MKTAISIPDKVYESAERLATQLGQSRSHLYTLALSSYLARHLDADITKKLNEVYGKTASTIDPQLARLQAKSLPRDEW